MSTQISARARISAIWNQTTIPVVLRKEGSNPVQVRLPYAQNNRTWLQAGRRNKPKWLQDKKRWEVPKSWFEDLVRACLDRYQKVYVVQLHQEQQKCAPACWNAKGFHCECSCMGENHGSGQPDGNWHEVSETFAFQWEESMYACRLITKNGERART